MYYQIKFSAIIHCYLLLSFVVFYWILYLFYNGKLDSEASIITLRILMIRLMKMKIKHNSFISIKNKKL